MALLFIGILIGIAIGIMIGGNIILHFWLNR